MKKLLFQIILVLFGFTPLFAQYQPDWESLDKREIPLTCRASLRVTSLLKND